MNGLHDGSNISSHCEIPHQLICRELPLAILSKNPLISFRIKPYLHTWPEFPDKEDFHGVVDQEGNG